ncbi:putative membrane protein [Methylophilus rhizosphaerae]|uniref:Putative membrane protein n=1 Tax=Methylophilus rhizosphaerae TaxID=492660 RepID=A0A1G9ECE8_9PROT|nr:bestrophin family ion channel [Methylophilus rhizosphaerae]SDK73850.1 putative membrane protein [Methylophilus rhizosphaerae]
MIVRSRPHLFELFFIIKGSIVLRIIPLLIFVATLSTIVVSIYTFRPDWLPRFDGGPFALLGITLSIFLAFRNNACYERWWEARKIWGDFVLTARNLARVSQLLDYEAGVISKERRVLLECNIAYAQALLVQLRPVTSTYKIKALLPESLFQAFSKSSNPPEVILREMQRVLVQALRDQRIDTIQFKMLDELVQELAHIQAACERIQNTPIPFGYTLLLHRTAYTFCFLLPFCFANTLGWATPFVTALAAYTLFGLDALGNELEEPFSMGANALPISALADVIEIDMREALNDAPIPPMPTPKDFVLM